MMYHNPQAVVQVNGRRSRVFAIERSVRQGCPLFPLLYVLALEPLLRRLRDERTSPSLRGIPFVSRLAYLGRSLTGDSVWRRKASRTFPRFKSNPKAEGRRRPLGEALFVRECRKALRNLLGSSDLSRPRKELYRELVAGPLLILLASGEAGRRRRSALTGIGRQDRAS